MFFRVLGGAAVVGVSLLACGTTEGGAGPSDAATDAAVEGAALDDASVVEADAEADAAPTVDAGHSFCSTLVPAPKFCDDFDDGEPGARWTTKTEIPGFGALYLDEADVRSAPASLRAESVAGANQSGNAALRRTVIVNAAHVALTWSAKLPAAPVTSGAMAIASVDVSLDHGFVLWLRDQDDAAPAPALLELTGGLITARHVLPSPPLGVWTRIRVDLDLTAGKASVSYDGAQALDAAPFAAGAGSEVTVRLGNVYAVGPLAKFVARYDDVVIDY